MKERVSITLDSELVKGIDSKVNGTVVRNRSHAIELAIRSFLGEAAKKKAVIFAGGNRIAFGGRQISKPMIRVLGKPILEHLISELKRNRVDDITVAMGYASGDIEEYFGDGSGLGVEMQYVKESQSLGTEGALLNVAGLLGTAPFIALNGDQVFRMDLDQMYKQHMETGALITIALSTSATPTRFGVMKMEGHRVTEFVEKPKTSHDSTLISTGTYVISPKALALAGKRRDAVMLEESLLPKVAKAGKLYGYLHSGSWYSIDNISDVKESVRKMEEGLLTFG